MVVHGSVQAENVLQHVLLAKSQFVLSCFLPDFTLISIGIMVKNPSDEDLRFKFPIEEVSADFNYAKYLEGTNSNNEYDELFVRKEPTLQKRIGEIRNVSNLALGIFGLEEGGCMLNALNVDTDVTTAALLRVHILRILLTIWLFFHINLIRWLNFIKNVRELIYQFIYMLSLEANVKGKKLKLSVGVLNNVVDAANYHYYFIERFPIALCQFLCRYLLCYSPSGFREFQESFPLVDGLRLPQSTGLLLKVNDNLLPLPPEIPQPFLDNEKQIKVPSKKEYLQVVSLRNEHFTQRRAHIAAEKVRMLSEIGRFVTWNCLLPSMKYVDIYERYGCLWDKNISAVEENLEILGTSILNELCSFTNTCSECELNELRNIIPEITLFDIATGTKHIVHGNVSKDFGYELEFPDSLSSSTSDKRVLTVYLSDKRLREELLLSYTLQNLNKTYLDNNIQELLPFTPDLIVVTGKSDVAPLQTYGFACADENDKTSKLSLIYSKVGRFGFNQFSRSIFDYIVNNSASLLNTEDSPKDDVANSNQSILSYASQQSGQCIAKFFQRVRRLRLFDLNSNKEIVAEE